MHTAAVLVNDYIVAVHLICVYHVALLKEKRRYFYRRDIIYTILFLKLLAFLICDRARSFACRLARGLAFTAAAFFCRFTKIA